MIRFFQTGIIFIYFVPEEEVKSLIEDYHISVHKTDMSCDLPDLDWFRFRLDSPDLECLGKINIPT